MKIVAKTNRDIFWTDSEYTDEMLARDCAIFEKRQALRKAREKATAERQTKSFIRAKQLRIMMMQGKAYAFRLAANCALPAISEKHW